MSHGYAQDMGQAGDVEGIFHFSAHGAAFSGNDRHEKGPNVAFEIRHEFGVQAASGTLQKSPVYAAVAVFLYLQCIAGKKHVIADEAAGIHE